MIPDDPRNGNELARHQHHDGLSKDPLFMIRERDIGPDLQFRQDKWISRGDKEDHGVIEPRRALWIWELRERLAATKDKWLEVDPRDFPLPEKK